MNTSTAEIPERYVKPNLKPVNPKEDEYCIEITDKNGNTFSINKSNILLIDTVENPKEGIFTRITVNFADNTIDHALYFTKEKYSDIVTKLFRHCNKTLMLNFNYVNLREI